MMAHHDTADSTSRATGPIQLSRQAPLAQHYVTGEVDGRHAQLNQDNQHDRKEDEAAKKASSVRSATERDARANKLKADNKILRKELLRMKEEMVEIEAIRVENRRLQKELDTLRSSRSGDANSDSDGDDSSSVQLRSEMRKLRYQISQRERHLQTETEAAVAKSRREMKAKYEADLAKHEAEVANLKNSEIDVLRKQLLRAEQRASREVERAESAMGFKARTESLISRDERSVSTNDSADMDEFKVRLANAERQASLESSKAAEAMLKKSSVEAELAEVRLKLKKDRVKMRSQQDECNRETHSLKEEIRRLNREMSALHEKYNTHDEDLENVEDGWTSMYDGQRRASGLEISYPEMKGSSFTSPGGPSEPEGHGETAGTDLVTHEESESLLSVISMLRDAVDQTSLERDNLSKKLAEEEERSKMELRAFANTLKGVDELRTSAEGMSREIRRIKIKGYKPTRSDLISSVASGAGTNFGELTDAVEASEAMEVAIRHIESQNYAMEDRSRVVSTPDLNLNRTSNGRMMRRLTEDGEGSFLSFWNSANEKDEKDEKKKKSKRKKKKDRSDAGSVFTSFF